MDGVKDYTDRVNRFRDGPIIGERDGGMKLGEASV